MEAFRALNRITHKLFLLPNPMQLPGLMRVPENEEGKTHLE